MHELGVVFHIMDSLEKVAAENEVKGISYLHNCWKWAVKKRELFSEAELIVEPVPAVTYCEGCGQTYPTVEHGKICPYCHSPDTWLLQGNEFNIKEIEVY